MLFDRPLPALRAPDGCPWDREQDHQSLRICLIEECCELLDTIDRLDFDHMREELGDVLLQVIFHTQLAEEEGRFDLEAVAAEINEKLIRRHPHIFGETRLETSDQVLHQWDAIKAGEKGRVAGAETGTALSRICRRLCPLFFTRSRWPSGSGRNRFPAEGWWTSQASTALAD